MEKCLSCVTSTFLIEHFDKRIQDQTSSNLTQSDLRLLQLLAGAGLYPQVSIADSNNTYVGEYIISDYL